MVKERISELDELEYTIPDDSSSYKFTLDSANIIPAIDSVQMQRNIDLARTQPEQPPQIESRYKSPPKAKLVKIRRPKIKRKSKDSKDSDE